ncbi:MAG TPA: efflux RND transporter periplasmic adaptor subunit [Armatimonadota bacterium]|nr:efflux RND transporter periplasmic adaptor subunit [Armatimonadota bacterium]
MKKWLFVLIVLLALGGLIVWRFQQKHADMAKQTGQRMSRSGAPASVEFAAPQFRDIVNSFTATGTVEAVQDVKITPKVSGRIEYLRKREGDHVKHGEVLVRIDQSDVQAQVRQERANLAEAQYRLAQAELTQSTTDTSVSTQIRQQKAGLESAKAEVTQAEATRAAQYKAVDAAIAEAKTKIDSANAVLANAKASLKSAQANLDNATSKCNRITSLYSQGYVAAQDVDDAKTAVSVQQASVETARGQVESAEAALSAAQAGEHSVEQQANVTRASVDANLATAKAKEAQAQASVDLANANVNQSPAYKESLKALRAGIDAARASLDSAIAKVDDTILRSPLDGVVTARNMDPGSMASPSQSILTVQAMKQVWVTIAVPEDVCAKIHVNQPAAATFDALGGQTFNARIAEINPAADLSSRQYTVRVILDNKDNRFAPGMFARVSLATDKAAHMLAVPREAIKQQDDGSSYVVVAGPDKKAEFRPVETGPNDASWIAILSGITPSEKVVVMSASPVREGQTLSSGHRGRGGKRGGQGGKEGMNDGKDGARGAQDGTRDGQNNGQAGQGAHGEGARPSAQDGVAAPAAGAPSSPGAHRRGSHGTNE